ncbi:hypothetical protein CCACVL1_08990 [Corchorus capsularis]|uniref:Uncharacterized protein n=1 Tax=Corchorus capsularis TaxID=210143 RepID=A0A1R3IY49_COCAP|nr:hypothetical protein CCACVL1_08990 [Corchorus capsularis]
MASEDHDRGRREPFQSVVL